MKIKRNLGIAGLFALTLGLSSCASTGSNAVIDEPTKQEVVVNNDEIGPYTYDISPQIYIDKLINHNEYQRASMFLQIHGKKFKECEVLYYEGLIGYGLLSNVEADTSRTQEELKIVQQSVYETLLDARNCTMDNYYSILTQEKKNELDSKISYLEVKLGVTPVEESEWGAIKALYR